MTRTGEYRARTVTAERENEFGGWTCWVDFDGELTCLMRAHGGPRVFKSAKAALAAGRKWIREDSDESEARR